MSLISAQKRHLRGTAAIITRGQIACAARLASVVTWLHIPGGGNDLLDPGE